MEEVFRNLGLSKKHFGTCTGQNVFSSSQKRLKSFSPVDGDLLGTIQQTSVDDYQLVIKAAKKAVVYWRNIPAPKRGDVVRCIANRLREHKKNLGALVSYEMGKSLQEGLGEVQEMIDICDFSLGLSRQLCGMTMHSERPQHRMYEQWHPLGVVGIITAFNFPVAVWAWNAMIAAVAGNVSIWKPSEKTPMTAIAVMHLIKQVVVECNLPEGIFNLMIGDPSEIGEAMIADREVALISATGSCTMGRRVSKVVSSRLGKVILELGGNNAVIVTANGDLKLAIPAVFFGAIGTAGQRCTTTRRVIIHESCYEQVKSKLLAAYKSLKIGDPLDKSNHMGPLIDEYAVQNMQDALQIIKAQGGEILYGGKRLQGKTYTSKCYVKPALVAAPLDMKILQEETFAPILYILKYKGSVEEAIAIQNNVTQGLSSAIFTDSLRESEIFLSANGSDCGLANVNIGTSGAEIGGAFGGEKDTGGGRESGSDAWKSYMRRQTNTINFSHDLPLAQGIKFDI